MMSEGGADLRGEDLSWLGFRPPEGSDGKRFEQVTFGSHPVDPDRPPAKLLGTVLRDNTFVDCHFEHVVLEDADLRGCTLRGCDFRYVVFRRATLEDAEIT